MLIKLDHPVVAFDAENSMIQLKEGEGAPKLKDILLIAVLTPHKMLDQNAGFKEKQKLATLAKRIAPERCGGEAVTEVEITADEAETCKQRAGVIFLQPSFVGRIGELLDGKE